ncbi:unnamed protein product, partial [marine sediment metagenome]
KLSKLATEWWEKITKLCVDWANKIDAFCVTWWNKIKTFCVDQFSAIESPDDRSGHNPSGLDFRRLDRVQSLKKHPSILFAYSQSNQPLNSFLSGQVSFFVQPEHPCGGQFSIRDFRWRGRWDRPVVQLKPLGTLEVITHLLKQLQSLWCFENPIPVECPIDRRGHHPRRYLLWGT